MQELSLGQILRFLRRLVITRSAPSGHQLPSDIVGLARQSRDQKNWRTKPENRSNLGSDTARKG